MIPSKEDLAEPLVPTPATEFSSVRIRERAGFNPELEETELKLELEFE